ncbi:rhomboid-related protein 4-like [Amblyomma americanum]
MEWNQDKALPAWLVWLEVVFIHVVAPQSSLLGHMAGVLVGFAYVYGVSLSSSLITPTFVATLVSGLILALRAPALPPSWTATLHAPCLSADLVFNRGHWELLLLSPLHAPSDLHAAYVVCSLLFLGSRYERYIGPVKFAIRMLAITLATGFVYCLSAWMILPSSLLGTWSIDGVHPYEVPYKCFTGCTAALLALKVSLAQGARGVGSQSVPWYLAWLRGRYPFLWLELPCPPLLGAILEAAFLRAAMPFLWTAGNAAGIVVGLFPGLIFPRITRAEPPSDRKAGAAVSSFCGI